MSPSSSSLPSLSLIPPLAAVMEQPMAQAAQLYVVAFVKAVREAAEHYVKVMADNPGMVLGGAVAAGVAIYYQTR